MSDELVLLNFDGDVAIVTLNAPEVLNALSGEMVRQLSVAVSRGSQTEGVRCLLINAAGRGFCAGANLQARGDAGAKPPAGSALETHYAPLMNKYHNSCFLISNSLQFQSPSHKNLHHLYSSANHL